MNTTAAILDIADQIGENHGGTFDPVTGEAINPGKGYAVSLEGFEVQATATSLIGLCRFLRTSWPNAKRTNAKPLFIGAWVDSDRDIVYYDATTIVESFGEAVALANANNQLAIFDFENRQVIAIV